MTDFFRAISFNDNVTPVFEALSEWCKKHRVDPQSIEGCAAASRLFDLFQAGVVNKDMLLVEIDSRWQ